MKFHFNNFKITKMTRIRTLTVIMCLVFVIQAANLRGTVNKQVDVDVEAFMETSNQECEPGCNKDSIGDGYCDIECMNEE